MSLITDFSTYLTMALEDITHFSGKNERPHVSWNVDNESDLPAMAVSGETYIQHPTGKDCLHSFQDRPSWERGGIKKWHRWGVLHRIGAAAEISSEHQYWFSCGLLHRDDGPAYIAGDLEAYAIGGSVHREDAPAMLYSSGVKVWVREGVVEKIEKGDVTAWVRNNKVYQIQSGPYRYCFNEDDGELYWGTDGTTDTVYSAHGARQTRFKAGTDILHCELGPAIEEVGVISQYYIDGKLA
jgi:hypothetical protein